jgi:hypothetical protein
MPAGSKPGERRGNAKGGKPLNETIIKGEAAERVLAAASASGRKLAVDVLDDFMGLFAGMAAYYQPMPDGTVQPGRHPDENKFEKYARLTIKVAGELAPYQSATFRAILAPAAPNQTNPKNLKRKFTLLVFDNERPQQVSDDAKQIEGKVVKKRTKK